MALSGALVNWGTVSTSGVYYGWGLTFDSNNLNKIVPGSFSSDQLLSAFSLLIISFILGYFAFVSSTLMLRVQSFFEKGQGGEQIRGVTLTHT